MAVVIRYPDGSTETIDEVVDAKRTKDNAVEFYDRDGRLVKTVDLGNDMLRWTIM